MNVGAPEVLVILLVALIVLGPARLPEAARQVGKVLGEVRRVASGFQNEIRDAVNQPAAAAAPPPAPA
ncbi:MAG: Sec-independent protein translocase protein TatB, partial [Acidimicrobiales bacterium]